MYIQAVAPVDVVAHLYSDTIHSSVIRVGMLPDRLTLITRLTHGTSEGGRGGVSVGLNAGRRARRGRLFARCV